MNLEQQLADGGFKALIRFLDAELTLHTSKGTFALFSPRSCLHVENGKLILGHPCELGLAFERADILHVSSGVSVSPYPNLGHRLFQRIKFNN
jgi:hypothetical protein